MLAERRRERAYGTINLQRWGIVYWGEERHVIGYKGGDETRDTGEGRQGRPRRILEEDNGQSPWAPLGDSQEKGISTAPLIG